MLSQTLPNSFRNLVFGNRLVLAGSDRATFSARPSVRPIVRSGTVVVGHSADTAFGLTEIVDYKTYTLQYCQPALPVLLKVSWPSARAVTFHRSAETLSASTVRNP